MFKRNRFWPFALVCFGLLIASTESVAVNQDVPFEWGPPDGTVLIEITLVANPFLPAARVPKPMTECGHLNYPFDGQQVTPEVPEKVNRNESKALKV
jgi:hypothetical protein